jgi:hypothetical protein
MLLFWDVVLLQQACCDFCEIWRKCRNRCHPREGGDPGRDVASSVQFASLTKLGVWVPAFAGMTEAAARGGLLPHESITFVLTT